MEIAIIVLSIFTSVLGYTTFNLLRKVEKTEDVVIRYDAYIKEFNKQIEIADERLKKIDEKGTFKSDDEIGWFFKNLKGLQLDLSRFKQNQ